jgi:hypothetical protein
LKAFLINVEPFIILSHSTDDKLQMVRDLEAAGQLKPLTCGPLHAAKWAGSTGYTEGPGHWCNVLLYDFLVSQIQRFDFAEVAQVSASTHGAEWNV